jgi:ribosomal protein S18 acetylase RimI-like enzyme
MTKPAVNPADERPSLLVAPSVTRRPSIKIGHWPNDPTVALLTTVDYDAEVDANDLASAVDRACSMRHRLIRTGALHSSAADLAIEIGFSRIDELMLLGRSLDREPSRRSMHRLRPLRRRHYRDASMIDLAAFGPRWANDVAAIADACNATPRSRAVRASSRTNAVLGYAVSGVSHSTGYLQRLAVDPRHQRQRIGIGLVDDGVRWMRRQGAERALVNTSVHNDAAIALYLAAGFADTGDRLHVLEWDHKRQRQ